MLNSATQIKLNRETHDEPFGERLHVNATKRTPLTESVVNKLCMPAVYAQRNQTPLEERENKVGACAAELVSNGSSRQCHLTSRTTAAWDRSYCGGGHVGRSTRAGLRLRTVNGSYAVRDENR